MAGEFRQRYHLQLFADDDTNYLFWPLFADDDDAVLKLLLVDLQRLVEAYPTGELYTDDGVLIWRKGTLDA